MVYSLQPRVPGLKKRDFMSVIPRLQSSVSDYIEARDALNATGYLEERNQLRSDFLSTEREEGFENNLRTRISRLPDRVQDEAIHRIAEWSLKLQKEMLTESAKEFSTASFLDRVVEFYSRHSELIQGPVFEAAYKTRAVLRTLFYVAHKNLSVDEIIEQCSITDVELQNRMHNEWALKGRLSQF